jgi:thioredoxin-related protein
VGKVSKNFEVIFKEFMSSETFVMSRELLEDYKRQAAQEEQERIIKLLTDLNAIRRDALGHLVAFDTYGEKVIYLPGLESK